MRNLVNLMAPDERVIQAQARQVLIIAGAILLGAVAGIHLTASKPLLVFFDNVHWTVSYGAAAWLAWLGVRAATPEHRPARRWFAIGLSGYTFGQVLWDVQVATGWNPFPGPSDFFFLWLGPCTALGLIVALRTHTDRSRIRTAALDASALSVMAVALTLALHLPRRGDTGSWPLAVLVAYPVGLLTAACIGLVLVPTLRMRWEMGWLVFLGALLMKGAVWMHWNSLTLDHSLQDGSWFNTSFSVAALAMGLGAMSWRVVKSTDPKWERHCEGVLRLLPLLVVMGAALAVVLAWTIPGMPRAVKFSSGAGAIVVTALALARQSILLRERDQLLEAERLAGESQLHFKTLFETSQDAILIMDGRGCVDCNSSTLKLFGCEKHQIVGRTPAEFSPELQPDGRRSDEKAQEFIAAALNGQPKYFEWTSRKLNGSEFYAEIRLNCIEQQDERLLQAVIHDITERKLGEAALRASEENYRMLVENMGEGLLVVDNQDAIRFVNQRFCKLTGYAAADLLGQNASALLLEPAEQERMRQRNSKRDLGLPDSYVVQLRCRSGKPIRCRHTTTPFDLAGGVAGSMAIVADITENQKLEEQLRQAQKMEAVGQLAGGVAHDFNNILTVIQGYGSMLLMSEDIHSNTAEAAQQIVQASERAANLTRQLLAFSRRQVMQPRLLDLNEIVTSLTKMLQRILGEDVRLQLNLHSRPLITRADAGMLDQVLLNLVVNARDAMPGGGRLFIETEGLDLTEAEAASIPEASAGEHVCLRVTDTGCGIAPEHRQRIFEPFFTTKESGKGTGLGLATVFGIVKQHGGSLTVESEIGKGTTFRILLPASEVLGRSPAETAVKPEPRGGTESILLVEDEPSVRILNRAVLERVGYRVFEAPDGPAALRIWEQHQDSIRLLLTDIVMPEGLSGFELATRLRARNPRLRVMFTSGYSADLAGRELALQEGQNFIQKPSSPDQLLETVRRCLDG